MQSSTKSTFHFVEKLDFEGTVISSDPPCKDGNKGVPLKALPDQVLIRYQCSCVFLNVYFHLQFLCRSEFLVKNNGESIKIKLFRVKTYNILTFVIRLIFQGNRYESDIVIFVWKSEITLTVPLKGVFL